MGTLSNLRRDYRKTLAAARNASLPSVRAYLQAEADILARLVYQAEVSESRRENSSRFASRCY
jgi:hypothetical protein